MRRLLSFVIFCAMSAILDAQPGTVDLSFDPGAGSDGEILSLALQSDGRIIVGGAFSSFQGIPCTGLARLEVDGSLDATFTPNLGPGAQVTAVEIDLNGSILIGGWFFGIFGTSISCIARLLPDGSLDTSFNPGTGANYYVNAMAFQPDGRILLGGNFATVDGVPRKGISRLHQDGSLDLGFDPGSGFQASWDSTYSYVEALSLQSDGKILVGGAFDSFNGQDAYSLARLNADGSMDTTYLPNITGGIYSMYVDTIDRVIIAGWVVSVNGVGRDDIARLNNDGSLDPLLDVGMGSDQSVEQILLEPGGRILACGGYLSFNGQSQRGIVRLNDDGTIDSSFSIGSGVDDAYVWVHAGALQSDGKILLAGWFTSFNGIPRNDIVRLNGGCLSSLYYLDADSDSYGDPTSPLITCDDPPPGYVSGGVFDCNDTIASIHPYAPCDDGDVNTGNDTWGVDCTCTGLLIDCLGNAGGPGLPSTPCDDELPNTINDTWTTSCDCQGEFIADCEGVPDGPALPGAPCDDGILATSSDSFDWNCECHGFDCVGVQGGNALPGFPCSDSSSWTYNDTWNVSCECVGVGMTDIPDVASADFMFEIAPNPSGTLASWITVSVAMPQRLHLEVSDLAGRLLSKEDFTVGSTLKHPLPQSTLASGSYIVSLIDHSGRRFSLPWVIER